MQRSRPARGRAARLARAVALVVATSAACAFTTVPGASAATHYCNITLNGWGACEYYQEYVSYNEVDANSDAECEALSNSNNPVPSPYNGILYTPVNCIGGGSTSAGAHYDASLPALYPWVGNRHTYAVAIQYATHFDVWI